MSTYDEAWFSGVLVNIKHTHQYKLRSSNTSAYIKLPSFPVFLKALYDLWQGI
jgi:hypothetical protein